MESETYWTKKKHWELRTEFRQTQRQCLTLGWPVSVIFNLKSRGIITTISRHTSFKLRISEVFIRLSNKMDF